MAGRRVFEGWVYATRDGTLVGPISTEEMRKAIANGVVQPHDRVWTRWKNQDVLLSPIVARMCFQADEPPCPF